VKLTEEDKRIMDEEFAAWDKDPERNPYVIEQGDEKFGAYDNADEVETAFKAGFIAALDRLEKQEES